MPAIIPIIVPPIPDTFAASGTSSKHTIDIISPAANDNMKLNKELKKQNITSIFIDKIEINDNCYGYLRADMTNSGRIWQNGEMDLLITAA